MATGMGLAILLLVFLAFFTILLIILRLLFDAMRANFLVLTLAFLGALQAGVAALIVRLVSGFGLYRLLFDVGFLISMFVVTVSCVSVVIWGRAR